MLYFAYSLNYFILNSYIPTEFVDFIFHYSLYMLFKIILFHGKCITVYSLYELNFRKISEILK